MMRRMKITLLITAILGAYIAVSAAQKGPIQVWLLAFSPFVIIAIAFALYIVDEATLRLKQRTGFDD